MNFVGLDKRLFQAFSCRVRLYSDLFGASEHKKGGTKPVELERFSFVRAASLRLRMGEQSLMNDYCEERDCQFFTKYTRFEE